ncbi:type VII toxin-antitoxin system HepT family RNase toxin [Corallincola spongiicola]|uniref:DUF86 domain-containing protein n=1 Tax=Corallincola spongiicola TaxID=2520508 RepID=A0ABY1WKK2_9GAMM|nr:DUF86 domain-containing protein [Corallincola spongiicola]TAA39602.1 DUF86 domain-containing protein [Corallincola spongiicola]
MDDVIVNKAATIRRCLNRIDEEFQNDPQQFRANFTKQDSVVLNLQRACEAAIDIANRYIRLQHLGIPQSARDSFGILAQNKVISDSLCDGLQRMVALRNIAVHDYQTLNIEIVISVVEKHLGDFTELVQVMMKRI